MPLPYHPKWKKLYQVKSLWKEKWKVFAMNLSIDTTNNKIHKKTIKKETVQDLNEMKA